MNPHVQKEEKAEEGRSKEKVRRREKAQLTYLAGLVKIPRSVLTRHYTDSSPERLKRIHDGAGLRVRKTFSNVVVVINKTDLLDGQRVREVQELCKAAIFISAATGQGVPELEKIEIQKGVLMMRKMTEVGKLKEGSFIVIDDEPCRIVSFSTSPAGKHGHENAKINAIGLFDSQKHPIFRPTSAKIEVPIIERGIAEVLAIVANTAQLMDLTTYETFELLISVNFRGDVREGGEVEYIQALGRRKIERVKG